MSGLLQGLRRPWMSKQTEEPTSPTSPPHKENPWRGVFDPNTNPRMQNVGRSSFDVPDPNKPQKTTWDYHLDAQKAVASDLSQAAFKAMGAETTDDVLDAASLRKMFDSQRVAQIMEVADKNKDGRISYKEFCSMLRQFPCE